MKLESWLLPLASLAVLPLLRQGASPRPGEVSNQVPPGNAPGQTADGGLRRVAPLERTERGAEGPEGHAAGSFDPEPWRLSLASPDLERRELEFDRIVRLARVDERALSFLRELRADEDQPELAWTARLALREVDAQRPGLRVFTAPGARLADPAGGIDQLLEELGAQAFGMPEAWLPLPSGRSDRAGAESGRSVSIQFDGTLWHVRIREREDGEDATREYTGESLEAILEENPGLSDDLGMFHLGGAPQGFGMELGLPLQAPLDEVLRGLHGIRGAQPSRGFEWRNPDGTTPGRLRFFVAPQAPSQPLRTDVLGVRVAPLAADTGRRLGLAEGVGLYVQASFPGTIAHLLGIGAGDVLVELAGRPMGSAEDITVAMRERDEGQPLAIEWIDARGERQRRSWAPPAGAPQAPAVPPAPR